MPSGTGGMGTGSDTRIYNPRSESSHLYSTEDDEDYKYSAADPEEIERKRDKRQAQIEDDKTKDLPHIKIEVDHPNPLPEEMPPEMPPEDEGPVMDDENENAMGAEVSQLTGMPGSRGAQLDQAVGAKTGTGSAMGGYRPMLATGYPMDAAWSSLMKAPTPWTQKQFDNPPGGRQPWTANSRRRKIISRILSRYGSGSGLDNAPTAVERQHLGLETKQPLRLFPGQYAQYRGQQQRRRLLGAPLPYSPHGLYGERQFHPGPTGAGRLRVMPGQGGQMHSQLTTPQAPRMAQGVSASTGMAAPQSMFKAELAEIRDVLLKAGPALDYLHFSQLRSMLRRMKKLMEDKEHQAKAKSSPNVSHKDIGHRDGGTTNPTGGTETLKPEDDTKNWGAPGHLLVARGSGRSA